MIFVICPVRSGALNEEVKKYVEEWERKCGSVYWPTRDTDQNDPIGTKICRQNLEGMKACSEVHIFWHPDSKGSHFDLGMAFALNKPIYFVNHREFPDTENEPKSFIKVLRDIDPLIMTKEYIDEINKRGAFKDREKG